MKSIHHSRRALLAAGAALALSLAMPVPGFAAEGVTLSYFIDDNPTNVKVLQTRLRADGYEVVTASDGEEGLAAAREQTPDLILLDVVMPEINGFDVCRQLKSDDRTAPIPVIFVTAREEESDEARGFDIGAVDYITKPIRPSIVRARVRMHLELKRARDLLERLASIDGLTGIANRRQFDSLMDQEWKRATRSSSFFSLAIIDVDEFMFSPTGRPLCWRKPCPTRSASASRC